MHYECTPRGVCASHLSFDIEDGKLQNVVFTGGCNGNLKAVSKLVAGKPVAEITAILDGNTCGNRPTSCADQLCHALRAAQAQAAAGA